ncbi:PROTEIN PIN-LIKES 2 [Salix viminalis]|uniref:PROTEIN PIN-LIKES 2 n=1 Tax=Salix viminalis TaxID=40686 RepID=A0A9Q0PA13_SALVM|nr:PROTEIN PIN-LIKES 2 [Salix viminalis]
MESYLASAQKNLKSEGEIVKAAIVPLLKLITLTLFGLIIAHPKIQLVPKATFKLLSKLVFALFLPCLIFTQLGPSITLSNIVLWWFIPVNVIISTAIGCVLGCLVAIICRPPREFVRFTIIMTAFGNTGNIPLAIVSSVCHSSDAPFGPGCYGNGIAYVSFSQWVSVILVYTLVYHMMEPPLEQHEIVDEEVEIQEAPADLSNPLLVEADWPGIEEKETGNSKTPLIARLFNSISSISQTSLPEMEAIEEGGEAGGGTSSRVRQPPTIASFLAIVIGVIPALKHFVYGADAPLQVITESLGMIASAAVPSVMLILGGILGEGPNESKLGIRTTIGIIVARLLVLPVIGIGVIYSAGKWNLLIPGNHLYQFVLLLQYTTPSAVLLGAIASLRGYAVKEASALLFWQHVCAVVSLSIYMIVYFKLLLSYI